MLPSSTIRLPQKERTKTDEWINNPRRGYPETINDRLNSKHPERFGMGCASLSCNSPPPVLLSVPLYRDLKCVQIVGALTHALDYAVPLCPDLHYLPNGYFGRPAPFTPLHIPTLTQPSTPLPSLVVLFDPPVHLVDYRSELKGQDQQ